MCEENKLQQVPLTTLLLQCKINITSLLNTDDLILTMVDKSIRDRLIEKLKDLN